MLKFILDTGSAIVLLFGIVLPKCSPQQSSSTHISVQMRQPELQPGPSGQANQSSLQVIDSNTVVLPEHILPVPKNKRSNRGRKSSGANLLTGSPYRQLLEESIKSIAQRGRSWRRDRERARGGQSVAVF